MKKNKIYVVKIDQDFHSNLQSMEDMLSDDEEIVSTAVAGDDFVVVTKRQNTYGKPTNLLVEELKSNA